jgi:hypothetical protein
MIVGMAIIIRKKFIMKTKYNNALGVMKSTLRLKIISKCLTQSYVTIFKF